MSLSEVPAEVWALTRLDQIRLIQLLAHDLAQDKAGLIEPDQSYPVWSLDRAYAAADVLLDALEEEGLIHALQ